MSNQYIHNSKDKEQFVRDNMELFEKAYIEYYTRTHLRSKHRKEKTSYSLFIEKARERFGYSSKTVPVDIWSKFMFTEIVLGVIDRYRTNVRINDMRIRNVLGYVKHKPNPINKEISEGILAKK